MRITVMYSVSADLSHEAHGRRLLSHAIKREMERQKPAPTAVLHVGKQHNCNCNCPPRPSSRL